MSIMDDRDSWANNFKEGWLARFQKTGTFYWDAYIFPKIKTPVAGAGIDLKISRLMLISSAGGYLPAEHKPFDDKNPLGDYSIRQFPPSTPFGKLTYAHDHYDHAAVNGDPQVLLPLRHLEAMVSDGRIGALTAVISFMGYQPDISQVLDKTVPAVLEIAKKEKADAALLVPS
jgi:hypothetical protein